MWFAGAPLAVDIRWFERLEADMRWLWMVMLVVLAGMTLTGCEAIQGIFKAGVWTGVIMIVLVLMIVGFIAAKIRS